MTLALFHLVGPVLPELGVRAGRLPWLVPMHH